MAIGVAWRCTKVDEKELLALRDQQGEVCCHRKTGGAQVAIRVVKARLAALDQIELDPDMGSPISGSRLGIAGFRTWQIWKFPLLWCCFESGDQLGVFKLLGKRRDMSAIWVAQFAAS